MKCDQIYIEDDNGNTHTMTEEQARKQYFNEIAYAIQKPQGIIAYKDLVDYFMKCALAVQDHLSLGIYMEIEIVHVDTPGIAKLRIITKKQNWFKMLFAHIGLFFIKLSQNEIKKIT